MPKIFKKPWFVPSLLLLIIQIVVIVSNFPFNSWFIGWDNLLPELNFQTNIWRAFGAVWQENQGLGHLGGHGHAATLWHSLWLWVWHWLIPQQWLRPFFILQMWMIGGWGSFVLARQMMTRSLSATTKSWLSLIVALLYSFHLATVQQFYTPLESFIIFHGLLPWVIWSVWKVWHKFTGTMLLGFFALQVVFSSIGFLPPLFVVYSLILGLLLFVLVGSPDRRIPLLRRLKQALTLGGLMTIANLYWFLPSAYFTFTSSHIYLNSLNNQLSTPGFNLQSVSDGGLVDLVLGRGFIFWAIDAAASSATNPQYVMQTWHSFLNQIWILPIAAAFFVLALIGIAGSWRQKSRNRALQISMGLVLILMIISLGQRIPGVSTLSQALKYIPVVNQAFRAAFTKVSVPFVLSYSLMVGLGLSFILTTINQLPRKILRVIHPVVISLALVGVLALGFPLFQGQLLAPQLQIAFPEHYSQVLSFFRNRPSQERILHLPLVDNFGWHYYNWDHVGSGFWWYGLEQPIVDRTFDVWSQHNESLYWQLSTAYFQQDETVLKDLIFDRQIKWLMVDEALTGTKEDTSYLQVNDWLAKLEQADWVISTERFGDVHLFEVDLPSVQPVLKTSIVDTIQTVSPTYQRFDPARSQTTNYVVDETTTGINFPFAQLSSTRLEPLTIERTEATRLKTTVQLDPSAKMLKLPALSQNKAHPVQATVQVQGRSLELTISAQKPTVSLGTNRIKNPLSTKVDLPLPTNGTQFFIEINDSLHFVDTQATDEQRLENLYLDLSEPLLIKLIASQPEQGIHLTPFLIEQDVTKCGFDPDKESRVEKDTTNDYLTLGAQHGVACQSAFASDFDAGSVLRLSFDHQSVDQLAPEVCLTVEGKDNTCQNGYTQNWEPASSNWKKVTQLITVEESGKYWLNTRARSTESSDELQQISYRNLVIEELSVLATATIEPNTWQPLFEAETVVLDNSPTAISVEVPLSLIRWTPGSQTKPDNCDWLGRGSVTNLDDKILSAQDGAVSCYGATFAGSDVAHDYLLRIKGQNLSGKGLDFSVYNRATQRTDLLYLLDQTFDGYFALPGWQNSHGSYAFTLSSYSFPHLKTENMLDRIELIEFPVVWTSQITLSGDAELESQPSLTGVDSKDLFTFGQYVLVKNETPAWIIFKQGYHPGWLAIILPDLQSGPARFQPWTWPQLPHHTYNGWANAWEVPAGEHQILIIFWPQLLSWASYGLLGLTFLGLGGTVIAQRLKKPRLH